MKLLLKQQENHLDLLNNSCSSITYTFHLLFQTRHKSAQLMGQLSKNAADESKEKHSRNTQKVTWILVFLITLETGGISSPPTWKYSHAWQM